MTAGAGAAQYGGSGGTGRNSTGAGSVGNNFGGGGAGGYSSARGGDQRGGAGSGGQVIISWDPLVYYSVGSRVATSLTNWNSKPDGTGSAPSGFTGDNLVFIIQDGHAMTTSSTWNISGANTRLQIRSGGTLTESNTITMSASGTLQIDNGGRLDHNVNSVSIFSGTLLLNPGSTVNYGLSGAQSIRNTTYGNLTISGSGTKTLSGNVTVEGTLNLTAGTMTVAGNSLTLNGPSIVRASGNLNTTSSSTLIFGGSSSGVVIPSSVTTLSNLTISNPNGVTLQGALSTTTLTLSAGTLNTSASSYPTVTGDTPASIIGGSATSYVNGPLARTLTNRLSNYGTPYLFPVGDGDDYRPLELVRATTGNNMPVLRVSVSNSGAVTGDGSTIYNILPRNWLLSRVSGDFSSAYVRLTESGLAGSSLIGSASAQSGVYVSAGGDNIGTTITTSAAILNSQLPSYFAIGGEASTTFYSYQSGSWDDPATWTLDPSGTQWQNPGNYSPSTSPSFDKDDVVILSGRTVTITTNSRRNRQITVWGTLDAGTTNEHSFTTIGGGGRIRLAGDNFPAGDATEFITPGQGAGTVVYYGSTRNLTTPRTFCNVEVSMTPGNTLYLLTNYVINNDFTVTGGTFSINNSSTGQRIITVHGNVMIGSEGTLATGTGNARHQMILYGDFTNQGVARFTNRTTPAYQSQATNGIVDLRFLSDRQDQNIMCAGPTYFYRIEIDKGDDHTYILGIEASEPANFNLLGYANENHGAISQLTTNGNALGLLRGTVRIGNNVEIPLLSQAGNYNISQKAQLWIDRGTVRKNTGTAIVVYGKVKITNGLLETLINSGITFRENGIINIEGGNLTANQIRTTTEGITTYGGYVQTGGTVNVVGGTTNTSFYVFSLPYPTSVFNMSGGTLRVNTSSANGAILINSSPDNVKVTGGTVIAETQAGRDFQITSTAPFWNLEMRNSTTARRRFQLTAANNIGPSGNQVSVPAQPLRVLNDFRIWGKESGGDAYPAIVFDPDGNDLYIGGSLFIESGAEYTPVSGGTYPYDAIATQPTARNTTHFIRTAATKASEQLYCGDIASPLEFGNLVIDRTSGHEVKLTSASSRVNESVILDINGNATVRSGILNQNLYTIRTWGAIENSDRMGVWIPGVTPSRAQIQFVENPALTLTTGTGAVFGNVQVNVTPPSVLTLTSDVFIERMEYVRGLIYLRSYNLKVDNLWQLDAGIFENSASGSLLKIANNGYSGSSMIYTDGKASDGGLTLRIAANSLPDENESNRLNNAGPTTFPVGFTPNGGSTLYFRPAQMMVRNYSSPGYITIRPVMGELPTTNQSGGHLLQHYWRVSHAGFSSLPTVSYRFYYRNRTGVANVDLATGASDASFVPGKVLDENPYTRQSEAQSDIIRNFGNSNNSRAVTFNGTSVNGSFTTTSEGVTLENANYTAGVTNRFTGSVLIYYTRDQTQEARWGEAVAWTNSNILNPLYEPHDSRQPASSTVPGAGDVAVIGWIPWNDTGRSASLRGQPHCVWVTDTRYVAEVVFTKMTDVNGNPVPRNYRSNFQFRPTLTINYRDNDRGVLYAKLVKGEGAFWNRGSDPDYTIMDVGDFARQDSSYVIYENFENNRVISNTPELLPNIFISNDNWGGNDHNFTFARDINTVGNVELLGNVNLILPTGATGDINVGRDLVMFVSQNSGSGAEIGYANGGTARKVVVKGNLIMANANSVINVRSPNTSAPLVDHELHIHGNIIQGTSQYSSTGLNLYTGPNHDRITLFLDGDADMVYNRINGAIPNLYRLVINKGSSPSTTARFDTDYILNGPTSGAGVPKALELLNGTFVSNNPNSSRVLILTSGNDHFSIPSTAGLEIVQGSVRASGSSGISLDGVLTIHGGTLDMTGGDNPIEYSASGNATLHVTGGTVNVGGQIRRPATSDVGVLHYRQSGGTVVAGYSQTTVANRGVFEILNQGSSFTMTGGDLYIARSPANPSVSAFYFNPDTLHVGPSATIHIGHSVTPASHTIGIFAGKPLPTLRVNNTSSSTPRVTARLDVVPATITSLLQIDNGTTFNANSLDLTLTGNLNAFGTLVPGGNTVWFRGTDTQTINGGGTTVSFHHLEKSEGNILALNSGNTPLTVAGSLGLRAGTFSDNGNTVTVLGNVYNDAIHQHSGTGDGIRFSGSTGQILEGNGTFGKLTISNAEGVSIPVGNQVTITRALKMEAGVFNIGSNLLDLGAAAVIEEASTFSATNMIETNLSFTDNGLRKTFQAGASNFIFPVGSNGKYTPVTLGITGNGNGTGAITVKPADEIHPGIIEDEETGVQIVDSENALQYYWSLKAEGITAFSAVARMRYIDSDVAVTPPYTIADYHTARLLSDGSGSWLKYPDRSDVDKQNRELIFRFSNNSDNEISGDYTAGAADATLNGAIPDLVMSYQTVASGNWTTPTIWQPVVSGGPHGAIARINQQHTVDVTGGPVAGYMTEIAGTLKLYATTGHRLGIVNGTGTINLETGTIPAAVYDNFFSPSGGTLEFTGHGNYEIMGNVTLVNNLKLSGGGERRFPNNNITLNGSLIIDGEAGLAAINQFNRRIDIRGDLSRLAGSFVAGSGANATIAMSGTYPQRIEGEFTGSNAFNNLETDNQNDITTQDDVEVNRELRLLSGVVNVTAGSLFRLGYGAAVLPEGGSPVSFVNGPVTAALMNGNSLTFPVGSNKGSRAHGPLGLVSVNSTAGTGDWRVLYDFANATTAGYDAASHEPAIAAVSQTEYWMITGPAGGTAQIKIILDGSSDVASSVGNLTNLRVAGWNDDVGRWEIVGGAVQATGTATAGAVTTTSQVTLGQYSCFTLASVAPIATGTATITSATAVTLCRGSTTGITVSFTGPMPYMLTYSDGASSYTIPSINSSTYEITVSPTVTTTYTLISMMADGVTGAVTGNTSATVSVSPIPSVILSRSGSGALCEGASITFTATSGLANYTFRVDGVVVQNGTNNRLTTTSLPPGTPSVDVTGTSAAGCSATSSAISVTVNPLPAAAGPISGPASVCLDATVEFSIPAIANANSYVWAATNNATITGSGTNVNIRFRRNGNSVITVFGRNSCGDGAPSTTIVSVSTFSQPGPAGNITGPGQVCEGTSGNTYTVPAVNNATSYIWTYSGTGAVISGTDRTVTIEFLPGATNGNLRVAGTNGCATGNYSPNFPIVVNRTPSASITPVSPTGCSGTPISLTGQPSGGSGVYSHSWSGPGAAMLSSTTVASPLFNSPEGGFYDLTYTVTDSRGCVGSASASVQVFPSPLANAGPDITGLCSGVTPITMTGASASGSYSGTPVWSGSGGTWTQNPDPALATFTPSTPSGTTVATLSLTGANGCSGSTDTKVITWNSAPPQPEPFTVSRTIVCQGETGVTYTIPAGSMVNSYVWTYTGGTGAVIHGTGNSVTIDFLPAATSGRLSVTAMNDCGSSPVRSIDITVSVPPVATFTYPGSPYCPMAANPLPLFTGGGVAGYFTADPGLVFADPLTGEVDLTNSLPGDYLVTNIVEATGGCGPVTATAMISIFSQFTWRGTVDRDWNNPANWSCGIVPSSYYSAHIGNSSNEPLLSGGAAGVIRDLVIENGSTLTIAGNTLTITGTMSGNNAIDATAGTVVMAGTTPQTLPASIFTGNTIMSLTADNAAGVFLGGALNISGVVSVTSGTLASNGHLTLLSSAAGTALIDGSGAGEVAGGVTMQRYLPSGYGYKYFSSPFVDALVSEFGDEIDLSSGFPLLYRYNEDSPYAGWESYTHGTAQLNPLEGYAVNFGSSHNPATVDVTGTVNNGVLSINLYNHNRDYTRGFSLVGNPYPSPIDWNAPGWTKHNIDDAIYMFRASSSDQFGGQYSSYVGGISSDGEISNIISSMQGFMVHVTDGTFPVSGTLGLNNSVRVGGHSTPFLKSAASGMHTLIRARAGFADDNSSYDPLVIYFDNGAETTFNSSYDALKLYNTDMSLTNFYSLLPDGKILSINALPEQNDSLLTIPIGLYIFRDGEVKFSLSDVENLPPDVNIFFRDDATGVTVPMHPSGEYSVTLAAGGYDNRFSFRFHKSLTAIETPSEGRGLFNAWAVYGTVRTEIFSLSGGEGTITIHGSDGRLIYLKKVYDTGLYDLDRDLKPGVYLVGYSSGGRSGTKKLVVGIR